jgi:hypothetical protein
MPRWTRALAAPFRRFGQATVRAITSFPWGAGGPTSTAVSTTSALSLVPVFASVRIIADNVAALPLQLFRRDGSGRRTRRAICSRGSTSACCPWRCEATPTG